MFWFTFQQNHTINYQIYFFEERGRGGQEGTPEGKGFTIHKILSQIVIGKHMKMSFFQFHQNYTTEEFDFWEVKTPQRGAGAPISKIWKSLIHNGAHKSHQKFQHSNSIVYKLGELKCEEKDILDPLLAYKNFNIKHFDAQIFAIHSCMFTDVIEVLKINIYKWEQFKNDDENGQPSCVIYSCPAAAQLILQRLGQR